jgi:Zn ribbon nucleic-acid-binding protein
MDSIFDEDADEVGGEIEAYCPSPRCKADTTHTIISMYEDEVRRVQCVVCGEVHAYRKPRGDSAEEASDAVPKRSAPRRATWDDALARASEADLANCRPYSVRDAYEEGDVVFHPKFDVGFVSDLLPDNKVEILFRDEARILVHNRGEEVASRMPAISEIPAPREVKKKKRAKKPEAAPQPIVIRSKADIDAAIGRARAAAQARTDEAQRAAETVRKPVKKPAAAAAKGKPAVKAKPVKAAKPVKVKAAAKTTKKPAAKKPAKKPAKKK